MSGLDWDREKRTRPAKHGRLRTKPPRAMATKTQLGTLKALWRENGIRPSNMLHALTQAQARRMIRELQE